MYRLKTAASFIKPNARLVKQDINLTIFKTDYNAGTRILKVWFYFTGIPSPGTLILQYEDYLAGIQSSSPGMDYNEGDLIYVDALPLGSPTSLYTIELETDATFQYDLTKEEKFIPLHEIGNGSVVSYFIDGKQTFKPNIIALVNADVYNLSMLNHGSLNLDEFEVSPCYYRTENTDEIDKQLFYLIKTSNENGTI